MLMPPRSQRDATDELAIKTMLRWQSFYGPQHRRCKINACSQRAADNDGAACALMLRFFELPHQDDSHDILTRWILPLYDDAEQRYQRGAEHPRRFHA